MGLLGDQLRLDAAVARLGALAKGAEDPAARARDDATALAAAFRFEEEPPEAAP